MDSSSASPKLSWISLPSILAKHNAWSTPLLYPLPEATIHLQPFKIPHFSPQTACHGSSTYPPLEWQLSTATALSVSPLPCSHLQYPPLSLCSLPSRQHIRAAVWICPSMGRHYSLGVAHQASKEISVLSSVQDISEQSCGSPDQVVRPDRDIKVILPALLGFFQFFPLFLSSPWRVRHFKVLSLISVTEISSVLLFILASVFFVAMKKPVSNVHVQSFCFSFNAPSVCMTL